MTQMVKIIFEVPVSEIQVSEDGNWFNLPYITTGKMISPGGKERPAIVRKGKLMLPVKERDQAKPKANKADPNVLKLLG